MTLTVIAAVLGVALSGSALPAPAGGHPRSSQGRDEPETYFLAKRKQLEVRIIATPRRIVWTSLGSVVHCEGGRTEYGSISSQGWEGFVIRANRGFQKNQWEAYEGSGSYFTGLSGRVYANRIVGEYRAWEERLGEETFYPRCGTRSPRGEPMRFVAHRVEGPPWRSGRH